MQATLLNVAGAIVGKYRMNVTAGAQERTLPLTDMAAGNYLLHLQADGGMAAASVVVE